MNDKQKNKAIIYAPSFILGALGVIFGIGIATFTERSGIAALVIIFSIIGVVVLTLILDEIFGKQN